jgi:hypothetical protein
MLSSTSSPSSILLGPAKASDKGEKHASVEAGTGSAAFSELLSTLAVQAAPTEPGEAAANELSDVVSDQLAILPGETGNILPTGLPLLPQSPSAPELPHGTSTNTAEEADGAEIEGVLAQPPSLAVPFQLGAVQPAPQSGRGEAPRSNASAAHSAAVQLPIALPGAEAGAVPAMARNLTITVKTPAAQASEAASAAPSPGEPAAIAPVAAVKVSRGHSTIESVLPLPTPAQPAVAGPQLEPFASPAPIQTAAAPMAAVSPTDLSAVLDRLVAAREALMPAETAFDIRHAEFGDISIRFEQSTQGMLSVELSGADPELQRAVTAAVASERSPSHHTESDSGRNTGSGQRGAAADREGSSSGREAQSRNEREQMQRRGPAGAGAEQAQNPSRSGTFA